MAIIKHHFRVGLSFPGEYRSFVEKVAEQLAKELGKEKVFYDNYYEAQLACLDLDKHLQNIYGNQCDLIVIFIGKLYEKKEWCRLEWRAIRNLIKTKLNESPLAIMPIRMDDCHVPGLFSIDGYIDVGKRLPPEIASLIIERLDGNKGTQNSEAKGVSLSGIPVTEFEVLKVGADYPEQSYRMLNPCNFDLNQLIEDSLGVLLGKKQGLVGLAVPCNDDAFRNHFCERLKDELGRSNIQIKSLLALNPLHISVEQAVNSIKKYKNEVQKRDIICPIRVEVDKKYKSYSDEFWQKICIAFPNSFERRLIIIMVGSKDKIFPKDVKKLEPPQFKIEHVHRWVVQMKTKLRWEEDIIDEWKQTMITDCLLINSQSEQLDIRSVYDHLNYSQELLQRNLPANAFLEELKQRI